MVAVVLCTMGVGVVASGTGNAIELRKKKGDFTINSIGSDGVEVSGSSKSADMNLGGTVDVDDPAEASIGDDMGLLKSVRRVSRRTESLRASQRIRNLFEVELKLKSPKLTPKLDPSLWSKLPREILLDIFDVLSVKDHYRLRRVCKDWHNKGSERRRLPTQNQVRVREPFFLLIRKSEEECSPFGTLALHAASGRWMWRPSYSMRTLPFIWSSSNWCAIGHLWEAFVVEGMLFQGHYMWDQNHATCRSCTHALFDVHQDHDRHKHYCPGTLISKRIPQVDAAPGSVLGMMVDEASGVFMLILGSCVADTLVFDSSTNKWESKPSRLVRTKPSSASTAPKSSVQLKDKMYLWMDSDEIHVYSPSSDQWSALTVPPRDVSDEDEFRGLGHWAGSLYAVTKNEQGTVSVWKLNMVNKQWSEYAQIPGRMFVHLMQPGAVLPIVASHCNGYLLMHVLAQPYAYATAEPKRTTRLGELLQQQKSRKRLDRRFILFNIANRRWEMVDMPYWKLWKSYNPKKIPWKD